MNKKISIINYGMGNTGSIRNMISYLGCECEVTDDKEIIDNSDFIILPGVGKFDAAVKNLKERNLFDVLIKKAQSINSRILGICLGMQIMCLKSEEGNMEGLGIFNAEVKSFSKNISEFLKVPHMGWNFLERNKKSKYLNNLKNPRFYFVHSFYAQSYDESEVIFKTEYGLQFVSALENRNNIGVQFHPEKSHKYGKEFFRNFLDL